MHRLSQASAHKSNENTKRSVFKRKGTKRNTTTKNL